MQKIGLKFFGPLSVCVALVIGALAYFQFPSENNACAGSAIAPSPCDPVYYQSLVARATLEADREVSQNQNLIYKPDSVLSYTCFDLYLYELAEHAADMFSETTRWGPTILGSDQPDHMNNALEAVVNDALRAYLDNNFHGSGPRELHYLGGRSGLTRTIPAGQIPNGGTYACDVMERVWMEAKCYNFQTESYDGFYTFEWYASNPDVRRLPNPCTAATAFTTNLSEALTAPPWTDDPTNTYLENFDPASCGDAAFGPLPTGLEIERPVIIPRTYDEHVCIQPGCHYQPNAAGTGGTCVP